MCSHNTSASKQQAASKVQADPTKGRSKDRNNLSKSGRTWSKPPTLALALAFGLSWPRDLNASFPKAFSFAFVEARDVGPLLRDLSGDASRTDRGP